MKDYHVKTTKKYEMENSSVCSSVRYESRIRLFTAITGKGINGILVARIYKTEISIK